MRGDLTAIVNDGADKFVGRPVIFAVVWIVFIFYLGCSLLQPWSLVDINTPIRRGFRVNVVATSSTVIDPGAQKHLFQWQKWDKPFKRSFSYFLFPHVPKE